MSNQSTTAIQLPLPVWLEAINRPRVKRILLFAAAAFFVAGSALSVYRHPEALSDLRWGPVALLLVLAVPLTTVVNAVEFALMARMVRQHVSPLRALEITVLTSAANLLPIPGGALVRIAALRAGGAHYVKGTSVTLLAALIWIATSFGYAGAWIAATTPGILGPLFLGGGIALLLTCGLVAARLNVGLRTAVSILLVRMVLVLLDAVRLYLCLVALNASAGFVEASAFVAASAFGSAVSVIPGGLGIREAATAALAPFIGVGAAMGFLTAALNRLISVPVLVPVALLLGVKSRFRSPQGEDHAAESAPKLGTGFALDVFIGTKAQYIKTAPLLRILDSDGVEYRLIDSGQHAKTAREIRGFLGVKEPDVTLQDRGNIKTIAEAARWFMKYLMLTIFRPSAIREHIFTNRPGFCLIHGDTPSTLLALIMARRAGKTIVHLEAGLRSFNLLRPFPEELIRIICMKFSDVLFAPSDWAEQNLRKMKVKGRVINVGQNTNIDAVYYALERGQRDTNIPRPYCVITVHRVETIMSKDRLRFILDVIEHISETMTVVFVRHDPTEKKLVDYGLQPALDAITRVVQRNLLPHADFIQLIAHADFIITDGGSIQEECYYLDRPCLVMRSETERLEGLGGNVVMGKFDWKTVENFLNEYGDRKRGHLIHSQSPSRLIAEHLGSR